MSATQEITRITTELAFRRVRTGAGCTALARDFGAYEVLLTADSDGNAPTSDTEEVTLYLMDAEGVSVGQSSHADLASARQFIAALVLFIERAGGTVDQYSWSDPAEKALATLTTEYGHWLAAQGIDAGCAEELLYDADHSAHGKTLTREQRAWLVDFIQRWDATARKS